LKNDVNVPFKKEQAKKTKKIFFVGVLKVTDKKSRIRILYSQRYGTADPYQNVTDSEF
jgi:hypothetical protein